MRMPRRVTLASRAGADQATRLKGSPMDESVQRDPATDNPHVSYHFHAGSPGWVVSFVAVVVTAASLVGFLVFG